MRGAATFAKIALAQEIPLILSLSKDANTSMGFYVYILKCADGSYYTGHTDQIEARVAAHQSGQTRGYTYD